VRTIARTALLLSTVGLFGCGSTGDTAVGRGAVPCDEPVEVIVWTGSQWQALAAALAEHPAQCADYYISIPATAGDKTKLRPPLVYNRIRQLGPNVHPLAEVTLGQTGWAKWVADGNGSWYDAGVEFRRRMAAAGLGLSPAETWLINEFDRTTRVDSTERLPVEIERNVTRPFPRQAMRDLVRGLYEGAPGMKPLRGSAEIGISFSHQNLPDVPAYKRELKAWLKDSAFWNDMRGRVRWLLREVYADTRYHGVPGSTLDERREHVQDFQEHLLSLVEAGPRSVSAARSFLRTTYVPLANAGYVAPGGDHWGFVSGHGNTEVTPAQMMHFVTEQIYAIRYYALRRPGMAPAGRLGFSWDPINRFELPRHVWAGHIADLRVRIALAIRDAHRPGTGSAYWACVSPGTTMNWCRASRRNARFTEIWRIFRSWN
jgi:hypothetical protein